MTASELDALMKRIEALPKTGDFRFDQAIGLAHDRLLMMWAESRRAEDAALDAANLPEPERATFVSPEELHEAHWRGFKLNNPPDGLKPWRDPK
jgi:hypothetical protein